MSSVTNQMKTLSLDEAPPSPEDGSLTPTHASTSRKKPLRRPRRVDPGPLPSLEECREAQATNTCMYFGFYADNYVLEKMLIKQFPNQFKNRDPADGALLHLALVYLRDITKHRKLRLHVAYIPQRAKDAYPEIIDDEVGEPALILGLFPLEREAYFKRISQEEADKIAELLEMKPTWWKIAQLLKN